MKKVYTVSLIIVGIICLILIFLFLTTPGIRLIYGIECTSNGGEWRGIHSEGMVPCLITYSDGGKICYSSNECEGDCLTNNRSNLGIEGRCQTTNDNQGCYNKLENERFECLFDDIIIDCDINSNNLDYCNELKEQGLFFD